MENRALMKGQKLKADKIIFLDIETTGLSREKDRIIEISLIIREQGKKDVIKTRKVNPGRPIPPETTKIHGIKDEHVKSAYTFKQLAPSLAKLLRGNIIAGFNSNYFDIPFLLYEFERAGVYDAFKGCEFIDISNLYRHFNPRDLQTAYADYCGKSFKAHRAEEDTKATAELLNAIYAEHEQELPGGLESVKELSAKQKNIDILGVVIQGENGPEFAIGKNKGKLVKDCRDYCNWIVNKSSFTENTKQVIKQILNS